MRYLLTVLLLVPALVSAQELHTFKNGEVADAEKLNESLQYILNNASGGCSATQQDNSVLIECADGTSGVIAGAGTVVIYPEGQIGQTPPSNLPAGDFVVVDANEVVLAKVNIDEFPSNTTLNGPLFRVLLSPLNLDAMMVNVEDGEKIVVTGPTNQPVFFPTDDCSGTAYAKAVVKGGIRDLGEEGLKTLMADTPLTIFQAKSQRLTGHYSSVFGLTPVEPCEQVNVAVSAGPLTTFTLPPAILNAVFPASVKQLP